MYRSGGVSLRRDDCCSSLPLGRGRVRLQRGWRRRRERDSNFSHWTEFDGTRRLGYVARYILHAIHYYYSYVSCACTAYIIFYNTYYYILCYTTVRTTVIRQCVYYILLRLSRVRERVSCVCVCVYIDLSVHVIISSDRVKNCNDVTRKKPNDDAAKCFRLLFAPARIHVYIKAATIHTAYTIVYIIRKY